MKIKYQEMHISKGKLKIAYNIERVEQFILNLFKCRKYKHYGYHEEKRNARSVGGKCSVKEPDHFTDEC